MDCSTAKTELRELTDLETENVSGGFIWYAAMQQIMEKLTSGPTEPEPSGVRRGTT